MTTRTKILMTMEEFDALPREEGVWYELNGGELVMTPWPRPQHNIVRDELGLRLAPFVKTHHLGRLFWETEFDLNGASRVPDLAFIRADRYATLNLQEKIHDGPDLAIEVASPSDTPSELVLKVKQYLNTGTRVVWLLYPEAKQAYIYRRGERPEIREAGQSLDDPELLPGFSVKLSDLFEAH
jgi:Uma2 family endonuclease